MTSWNRVTCQYLKWGEKFRVPNNFCSSIFIQEFIRALQSSLLKQTKKNPGKKKYMQPCVYRTQPQPCFEGESNEAISGGGANPWLGAMSLTWEMIQWNSDPLVCAFFTHTRAENWSKQKKHRVDFSHSWWVHRQAGDGRFLCRLIRVDCSTTACICQTRVKWNLQNFRDLWQPSPNIILLIRKRGSELPTASALIYLMHDSMRMPRPSVTNQTTGTKSCVDGQQRVSLCVSHELTPFGFRGNRLPRRFQTTSHAARMFKALLGLTDSYLESLAPPPRFHMHGGRLRPETDASLPSTGRKSDENPQGNRCI